MGVDSAAHAVEQKASLAVVAGWFGAASNLAECYRFVSMAPVDELEIHRRAIAGHCYRMLGSVTDADDAVQETMVRAWRNLERFEGRSSLKGWLHRIATNVCLDALADRRKRTRPTMDGPVGTVHDELLTRDRAHWIEPVPEAMVVEPDADPAMQLQQREQVRLAFVTALQELPPKQRAALLLVEVVGCSAMEAATALDTSLQAVNSALQRARKTLADRELKEAPTLDESHRALFVRYLDAFERYDVDALTSLMAEDATLSMPPFTLWLQGTAAIHQWLGGPGLGCRGSRIHEVQACGAPAFAQWRPAEGGSHEAWALVVLELRDGAVTDMVSFLDTDIVFPVFGLPLRLAPGQPLVV